MYAPTTSFSISNRQEIDRVSAMWVIVGDWLKNHDAMRYSAVDTNRVSAITTRQFRAKKRSVSGYTDGSRSLTRKLFNRTGPDVTRDAVVMGGVILRIIENTIDPNIVSWNEILAEANVRDEIYIKQVEKINAMWSMRGMVDHEAFSPVDLIAAAFLAIGLCPDHMEWISELGAFCSWGGRLYSLSDLHNQRDVNGKHLFTFVVSPDGKPLACHSRRERQWGINHPLSPVESCDPTYYLLPTPVISQVGAARAGLPTVPMCEGIVPLYSRGGGVMCTRTHLCVAKYLYSGYPEQTINAHTRSVL